jgi:hypothetical protein
MIAVSIVLSEYDPEAALIVVVPGPTTAAIPLSLMVATALFDELQVTWFDKS